MIRSTRSQFALLLWFLLWSGLNAVGRDASQISRESGMRFVDINLLSIEGRAFDDLQAPFDRLPDHAEAIVPRAVWNLSHHSAGISARFITDASRIEVRWNLTSSTLAMPHMPATGVSGLDLYVKTESGRWRWVANGRPTAQESAYTFFENVPSQPREFMMYLPLYNGVSRVEIGIPSDAFITSAPERPIGRRRPLVFYGTSITQGGCASRPGMVHTAILGRQLERPVINLGFSGNGKMELVMADLLAQINAEVFILDCLPNMTGEMVKARMPEFVKRLRRSRPETPILLVEDRVYADAFFKPNRAQRNRENREAIREVLRELEQEKIENIHFLPGQILLDANGEDTVDGSHPTDLGFAHQADAFLQALTPMVHATEPRF